MLRYLLLLAALFGGCSGFTTGPNQTPVAIAGPDRVVRLFDSARLDGGASYDPDGDEIGYRWELVAVPEDGTAELSSTGSRTTELVPDAVGIWMVRLTVNDGSLDSQPAMMRVWAGAAPCQRHSQCNDNLWCNGEEQCVGGWCIPGSRDCSAKANQCNHAGCDEDNDACVAVPKPNDTGCNDGQYCTVSDVCKQGFCTGTARDCSHLNAECVDGVCNEGTDRCEAQPVGDGQPCDDGVYCTVDETCQDGFCTGGSERNCPHSLDGCGQGFCNHTTDQCDLNPQPNGTECDDGDPCTFPDQCQSGVCQSGLPCPLGCNTSANPSRCYEVNPSNVGHDYLCVPGAPALTPTTGTTVNINTDDGTINDNSILTAQWVPQEGDARDILVLSFSSINIPQTTTVKVSGGHPLALIACGDATINGTIDASSDEQWAGPGGYDGGPGRQDGEGYMNGQGLHGFYQSSAPYRETGGGGGGHGRTGGAGGDSGQNSGGAGGTANGTPQITPLVGGSGGGGGGGYLPDQGGHGGCGGGVQITSGGALVIGPHGGVHVGGGGGRAGPPAWNSGGGGGAGGAILLEGASVTVQGMLAANGGGGGGANSSFFTPCRTAPQPGQPGAYDDRPAAGGQGCGNGDGGPGGRGGYGGDLTGEGIQPNDFRVSGGGGGAVGRIRLNSHQDSNINLSGATISPHCFSGITRRCTTGAVSLW